MEVPTSIMLRHQELIRKRCRVCLNILDSRRSYPKTKFAGVFLKHYNVNVASEDEFVFPTNVCDRHRQILKNLDTKKAYSTDMTLVECKPHSKDCAICMPVPVSAEHSYSHNSAKKRKTARKGGPGRGKVCKGVVVAPPNVASCSIIPPNQDHECVQNIMALVEDERQVCLEQLVMKLSVKDKSLLARRLGENQCTNVFNCAVDISSRFRTLPELANYNASHFVQSSNDVVRSFIEGCCKVSKPDMKKNYLVGLTLEMIYKVRYPSCIAPLSFMRNLASYVGHDKAKIMKINGASSPGGSYTTVTNWVKSLAAAPPSCPSGDIINIFDNDQVVGKTYTVQPLNRVKASVITNRAWIQSDPTGILQANRDFMPGEWLGSENVEEIRKMARRMCKNERDDPIFSQLNYFHREQLTHFLNVAITEVMEERIEEEEDGKSWRDIIDLAVEASQVEEDYQICGKCHTLVLRGKRDCPLCKINLKKSREEATAASAIAPVPEEPHIEVEHVEVSEKLSKMHEVEEERYSHKAQPP